MIFKGTATALVTPFTEDDKVDVSSLERIVDDQIENGIDALVVLGTTGEPATMTAEEKEQAVKTVVRRAKGVVPVIVGAGSNDTKCAIRNCVFAQNLGADAVLVVTPYYNKCTQEGLVCHYGAIAEATSLPVLCYNVPSRTGVNLLPETFDTLLSKRFVQGVKEASGNMEQIEKCVSVCKGRGDVISGDDALTVPVTAMGGVGVISVASNVCPAFVSEMTRLALSGDFERARSMQLALLPLISALFCEVNPIPVKTAMQMRGMCSSRLRLPLTQMSGANARKLEITLKAFDDMLAKQRRL